MRPTSVVTISFLSLLLVACGGGGDEPAARASEDGGQRDAASTSADPASTTADGGDQQASAAAADDPCAEALFDETATFTFRDELPFRFEYPAGWDHLGRSGETQISGSLAHLGRNGRRSHVGLIQYVIMREPDSSPDFTRQIFDRSMEPVGTVTLGGREVEVYSHRDPGAVTAKFLYPDDDGWHLANLIFGAAGDDCLPERRRIRDLVLESISDRS